MKLKNNYFFFRVAEKLIIQGEQFLIFSTSGVRSLKKLNSY
jgi:hypothetical protein